MKLVPEFYLGDDVVLLAADREGLDAFERALSEAVMKQNTPVDFISAGVRHEFVLGKPGARVDLQENSVIWHLPDQKASEILDELASLKAAPDPSHHFVDIDNPAETLILSVDEYLNSPIFASVGI